MRGTLSRTELRQVLAVTYHQVWWSPTHQVKHDDTSLPVWHEASGNYLDPATGELLPTWDQTLDALGEAGRAAARGPALHVGSAARLAANCGAVPSHGWRSRILARETATCWQTGSPAWDRRGSIVCRLPGLITRLAAICIP
jgi:hypothetical protein